MLCVYLSGTVSQHVGLVKAPEGEAWVWVLSSWQQEAVSLITGLLLEERCFFYQTGGT